ncbi:lipopolysaccharide heptosyltransferase II [candidate division GN15 bacterium]|uniref:lipopolysaccharide heptosyltransferase II n=1 Tax=candidate division GN15 bacterium TaxID=2072418 RepID=A0A855X3K3_9BACT|nr:MAG: lipopolysaccharide heptosyltransferase II [candidate division GN15 bacterium]
MGPRILIRVPNHLGDCIMALPMVNEVREAYPGSSVTVLVPEYLAEIFEHNPAIDAVFKIPAKYVHGMMAVVKLREIIAPHEFDVGFILPPSFGAAAGFKLSGIEERIGYIADGRRLLLTRPMPLPAPMNSQHRSETYFDLLRRATGKELEFVRPKLFLSETDTQNAAALLSGLGVAPEQPYAAIAFQAVAESRRWGLENYRKLADRLIEHQKFAIVLVGGPADQKAGDEIVAASSGKQVVNLAGKTGLRESAAVLAQAELFVGNDSGPAHLAAAVDCPIVVISGADDPKETSPLARHKRLIYLSHLECISCVKNKCPLKPEQSMQCMTQITVVSVLDQIADLLRETAG